jgi:hypothetical protein
MRGNDLSEQIENDSDQENDSFNIMAPKSNIILKKRKASNQ